MYIVHAKQTLFTVKVFTDETFSIYYFKVQGVGKENRVKSQDAVIAHYVFTRFSFRVVLIVIRDFFIQNNPYLLIRDSIRCLLHSHLHNRHHNIRHLLRSHHQGSHLCHPGDQNQVQAGHQLQLFSVFFCHCYCKKNEKRKF